MVIRFLADTVIVNVALITALALRLILDIAWIPATDPHVQLQRFVAIYGFNWWLVTAICLGTFAFGGFYTYGRYYLGRYKVFLVCYAVAQSYLFIAVLQYILFTKFHLPSMPRGVVILGFLLTLAAMIGSRTWTHIWEYFVRDERIAKIRTVNDSVRNILVVGGAGYVGSALLPKLLARGYRVRVLDSLVYGVEPIEHLLTNSRLELVKGDFRSVQNVVEAMRGMDAVIHLGAIVGDPACSLDGDLTVDVNLSATQMIAQVAKASGIRRFIFASTCSVYGACDEILEERSSVQPVSLYGTTKLAAEAGLHAMADSQFKPTLLRFATIYGLSGRTRFDLVVNLLTAKACTEGEITVHGGDQWRPFVHVDDVALAIVRVVEAPLALVGNEIFNVGSDAQNYTINDIGKLVHQRVFSAELLIDESTDDPRNYRVSFAKIKNKLGFEPNWTVEDGIEQVIEAIAGGDLEDYRDPRYSNVKFLSESGGIESIRTTDRWVHDQWAEKTQA